MPSHSFKVTGKFIHIADPCYVKPRTRSGLEEDAKKNLAIWNLKAVKGVWKAKYRFNKNKQVKALLARHEDCSSNKPVRYETRSMGVDSGQVGIWDEVQYPESNWQHVCGQLLKKVDENLYAVKTRADYEKYWMHLTEKVTFQPLEEREVSVALVRNVWNGDIVVHSRHPNIDIARESQHATSSISFNIRVKNNQFHAVTMQKGFPIAEMRPLVPEPEIKTWYDDVCLKTNFNAIRSADDGVACSTAYGDGDYSVTIGFDSNDQAVSVQIMLE